MSDERERLEKEVYEADNRKYNAYELWRQARDDELSARVISNDALDRAWIARDRAEFARRALAAHDEKVEGERDESKP